jgi:hypothetical protein
MTVARPVTWLEAKESWRQAHVAIHNGRRLYVCERFQRMQAWVDGDKIGDFDTVESAKAAAVKRAEQA